LSAIKLKAAGKLNLMNVANKICIFKKINEIYFCKKKKKNENWKLNEEKEEIAPLFSFPPFYVSPKYFSASFSAAPAAQQIYELRQGCQQNYINGLPACCESLQSSSSPFHIIYDYMLAYIEIKVFYYNFF